MRDLGYSEQEIMIETKQITNLTVVGFDYRTILSLYLTINIARSKLFTFKIKLNYLKDKTHSTLPDTKQWHIYASQHIMMVVIIGNQLVVFIEIF